MPDAADNGRRQAGDEKDKCDGHHDEMWLARHPVLAVLEAGGPQLETVAVGEALHLAADDHRVVAVRLPVRLVGKSIAEIFELGICHSWPIVQFLRAQGAASFLNG